MTGQAQTQAGLARRDAALRSLPRTQGILAAGGVIGALAASSCCIVPLALFALGISGAWIGNLTALAPSLPGRIVKGVLWAATGLALAAVAFDYLAPTLFAV